MQDRKLRENRWGHVVFGLVCISILTLGQAVLAEESTHAVEPNETAIAEQLGELQAGVARLEEALDALHSRPADTSSHSGADTSSGMAMTSDASSSTMNDKGMMGMGKMKQMSGMDMGNMSTTMGGGGMAMDKMGMMSGMKGKMGMMGMMKGMGGMGMPDSDQSMGGMQMGDTGAGDSLVFLSALPGFPGASHLYHIGQTGFFLDHGEHIELTMEQQLALAEIKEATLLAQESATRKVEEAEQELWVLTAADEPDAKKIEAKVRELENLRGDQRLAFIQAVGEAASLLTDGQRKALLGVASPMQMDSDSSQHQHQSN